MSDPQRPYDRPYFDFQRFLADPDAGDGFKGWAALALASRDKTNPEHQEIPDTGPLELEDKLPRWPSTLTTLDLRCNGGFYGLSVVLGNRGLGKTLLALGSCIEAAATQQWQAVYLSAELDHHEIAMRLGRYFAKHEASLDCIGYFHVVHLGRGFDVPDLCRIVEERTDPAGPPLLVCIDSVNTAAELSGGEYLWTLRKLSLWSMLARRMSAGYASFLLVSEVNKLGGAKGGALDYWADVVVRLARPKGGAGIELTLEKSRRTRGEGKLGLYARGQTRFEPADRVLQRDPAAPARPFELDGE